MPYFIKSETSDRPASQYHGDSGPVSLLTPRDPHPLTLCYMAAGEAVGIEPTDEHNGPRMVGPTLNTLTIKDGKRQSVADAYLTTTLHRANLDVRTDCLVDQVALGSGDRCMGVDVIEEGERRLIEADQGVILCGGTIGSPVILGRSGLGPAAELRSLDIRVDVDLPGVGQNLHDHLLSGGNLYRSKKNVPVSRYQHSESHMYIESDGGGGVPDVALACVVMPVVTECFASPVLGEVYTIMFGFTHPRSRGSLRLSSADPMAPPIIDPNYLAEDYDRRAYLRALDMALAVGHAVPLDEWHGEQVLPDSSVLTQKERLSFLSNAAYTHHHPVGTCRMGIDDLAVAGPDLSVHGVEGLYVVDGSIIPSITAGPVNAAIVAIAERASDLLKGNDPLPSFDPRDTGKSQEHHPR